jgi:hypothetical protein
MNLWNVELKARPSQVVGDRTMGFGLRDAFPGYAAVLGGGGDRQDVNTPI